MNAKEVEKDKSYLLMLFQIGKKLHTGVYVYELRVEGKKLERMLIKK